MSGQTSENRDGFGDRMRAAIGNPLEWSTVDKAALLVAINIPFVIGFTAISEYIVAHPDFAPYFNPENLRYTIWVGYLTIAWWTMYLTVGRIIRKNHPENTAYVYGMLAYWWVTIVLITWAIGHVTNPWSWVVFFMAGILDYLFFTRRIAYVSLTMGALCLAAVVVAERLGVIPYAPTLLEAPYQDGRVDGVWLVWSGSAALIGCGMVLWICFYSIDQWRAREEEIRHLSCTDGLTNVANRRHFLECLEIELARALRYKRDFCFVMLDLDHFKQINDTYGHLVGDRVLVTVCGVLERCLRSSDLVGRYGGEEFALMLPETDMEGAREVVERCRERIAQTDIVAGGKESFRVTVSIGCVHFPREKLEEIESIDEIVRTADTALYRAKQGGRNRVVLVA